MEEIKKNCALMFSHEFPPTLGGVGVVASEILNAPAITSLRWDLLTRRIDGVAAPQNSKVFLSGSHRYLWPIQYALFLWWFILTKKYAAIFLNEAGPTAVAGLFLPKIALRKCLVLVHGQEAERLFAKSSGILRRFLAHGHRRSLKHARSVWCVSYHVRQKILLASGVNRDCVKVVHTGISRSFFQPEPVECQATSAERQFNSELRLLTISRITREKGLEDMLDVFHKLVKQGSLVTWTVIGDGDYLAAFRSKVRSLGLSDRVHILGSLDRGKLPHLISQHDLFWLLSNLAEALPLVYIEAQAAGLPAIGWNKSGTKETIVHGVTGFLADTQEDVIHAIKQRKDMALDRVEIKKWAENFKIERFVRDIELEISSW